MRLINMESIRLDELQPLTDQEKQMIKHAKSMPITFDEDCPESTPEMLQRFRLAAERRNRCREEKSENASFDAELDAKLQHSYAQSISDEGRPMKDVFDELEKYSDK